MKSCWILILLFCSLPALALSGVMENASVHAMRKVRCSETQSTLRGGPLPGLANNGGNPDDAAECTEYELYTAKVSYIVRPRRAILLVLGGDVSIKLTGNELILHSSAEPKDIHCAVLAMTLLSEVEKREKEREWEREREAERSRHLPRGCYTGSGIEIPCDGERATR
jgi:hypothetical protein